jgi:hypothetical protein
MALSSLDVIWSTRVGGGGRTERRYLDLVIDGVPLSTRLGADLIAPFGWYDATEQLASVERLRRKRAPDVFGRVSLYVCPECGNLRCGAVTLQVLGTQGGVVWTDFGIQNNYEDIIHRTGFEAIGPFEFDGSMYHQLWDRICRSIQGGARGRLR